MRNRPIRAQSSRHEFLLDTLESRTLLSVAHKTPPTHAPKAPHPKHPKGSTTVKSTTTNTTTTPSGPSFSITDSTGNTTTYSLNDLSSLLNATLPSSATFSLNLGDILGTDLSSVTGSYSLNNSGSLTLNLNGLGDLSSLLDFSF